MHQTLNTLLETRSRQFSERLRRLVIEDFVTFEAKYNRTDDAVKFNDRLSEEYKNIKEGDKWGNPWDSAWFRLKATVPAAWKGKNIAARIDLSGECLIFSEDGEPVFALTDMSIFDRFFRKDIYKFEKIAEGEEEIELWVEAAANGLFGLKIDEDPDVKSPTRHGSFNTTVNHIKLCIFDEDIWQLAVDIEVLTSLMLTLPEKLPRRKKLLKNINEAIDAFQDKRENAVKCREILKKSFNNPAYASAVTATSIGHAHIDTGWLWPVKETIRKSARTFSSQLALIEKYPDYIFGASQPQHYEFIKQHYPGLYEKIKKAIKDGRWEVQGGMWVEADCNVISGESMVRQFVYGKNYFKDEFGIDVKNLWLPDVFGYSAAMPQILKKAGVDYFLTQKISWSQFNKFPHHTFMWEGIDGTEVLTHFIPTDTYNGNLEPQENIEAENRFVESDVLDEFLSVFGIGNGGGGPTEEYIERGLRQQNLEGCPKVKFDHAHKFFDRINEKADQLEKWSGELYLELHRATLTTQAKVKKMNRMLENKLRTVEALYSCIDFSEYPKEELDSIWKIVLINHFHDIIPGSSIKKVYDVTYKEHEDCLERCEKLINQFEAKTFKKEKDAVVIYNLLSIDYSAPVKLPEGFVGCDLVDEKGKILISQDECDGKSVIADIPANSFTKLFKAEKEQPENCCVDNNLVLENNYIRYEFAENGEILKAFDKESNKEVVNKGNIFSLYVDRPSNWDAWDIDIYYENELVENAKSVKAEKIISGPVRDALKFDLEIGVSTITQKVYLPKNSKRLDFETEVDWQEVHKMLRVSFDTKIKSSEATFDIQYGYVKRNTHRNTSWDIGKFEVAAHKYIDISDHGYGVALLNDCKYGHKVLESTLDLNLLRSSTNPDPDADKFEIHEFTYSIYPHEGALIESDVIHQSDMLNVKPVVFADMTFDSVKTPCRIENSNGVTLEVVKKAEKEDVHVIRLVERFGKDSSITLGFDKAVVLTETNLMEWEDSDTISVNKNIELTLKPFEIRTYKIK
jgi:alpha-mannosidase